jgi:D-alanyl-D-alanine carboxypeptidase
VGIEAVNSRIADIQSRMIAMQTQQATATKTASAASGTSAPAGSFATALADAMGTQSSAGTAKSYALNSKGIPTELAGVRQRQDPGERAGAGRQHQPQALGAGRRVADPDGLRRQGAGRDDRDHRLVPLVRRAGRRRPRKGLYSQGGLAAKPGTSEHGWGMATDLDLNNKAQAWMRANGEKYGFVENTPREPWHWAYKPKSV